MRYYAFICLVGVLFLANCTVKYVKNSPQFESSLKNFKRLTVAIDPSSGTGSTEAAMIKSMAEQELSHHKEFIVYPDPENKNVKCEVKIGKSQGVLRLKVEESTAGTVPYLYFWIAPALFGPPENGIKLKVLASLQKCDTKETLWEGSASSSYSLDNDEEQSLSKVYESKFGKAAGKKAIPYYHILKSLLDEIDSPVLTEAEQDEKIEVEAGG